MKKLILLLIMLLFPISTWAISYESITVADTAIGISSTYIPSTANGCQVWGDIYAFCTVETAQIRYRVDGTDPTSSEGHIANVNDIVGLNTCLEMFNFRAIRTGATSGVLKCTYY